jgi:hypothetical protein
MHTKRTNTVINSHHGLLRNELHLQEKFRCLEVVTYLRVRHRIAVQI